MRWKMSALKIKESWFMRWIKEVFIWPNSSFTRCSWMQRQTHLAVLSLVLLTQVPSQLYLFLIVLCTPSQRTPVHIAITVTWKWSRAMRTITTTCAWHLEVISIVTQITLFFNFPKTLFHFKRKGDGCTYGWFLVEVQGRIRVSYITSKKPA